MRSRYLLVVENIRRLLLCGMFTLIPHLSAASMSTDEAPGLEACGADIRARGPIPAWTGGLSHAPGGFVKGGYYPNPYADDVLQFEVTHANASHYDQWLTPGLKALLARYPATLRLPVFPTRRSHALKPAFYINCLANRENARLINQGEGIAGVLAGTPFPAPQSGAEAIWNHLFRMRGIYTVRQETEAAVFPDGQKKLIRSRQEIAFPLWSADPSVLANLDASHPPLLYYTSYITSPGSLAGGAFMLMDSLNRAGLPRLAWSYDQGQRRLRRVPLADDGPAHLSEGARTVDDTDMYFGHVVNYDWTLLGKRDILAPYNNYRMASNSLSYDELLKSSHPDPAYLRYEVRSVWVVEGLLKSGHPHVYHKRTFYLDEDSWGIVLGEQYDQQGQLWRVNLAYSINFYDLPMTLTVGDVYFDLKSGNYNVKGLLNEEGTPGIYDGKMPEPGYFSPGQLRQRVFR
jgi:hypothetical protein